jgi:hypothetical protein
MFLKEMRNLSYIVNVQRKIFSSLYIAPALKEVNCCASASWLRQAGKSLNPS